MIAAPYFLDYLLLRYGGRCVRAPTITPSCPPVPTLVPLSLLPEPEPLLLSPQITVLQAIVIKMAKRCFMTIGFIIIRMFVIEN